MAFRGTFDYSLDAKNRLTIPAKFRTALADGVVLAKGIESCVELWQADPPASENFPGFGRCGTDSEGNFRFATIAPGPDGEALNESDPLLSAIADPARRASLIARRVDATTWRLDIRLQGEGETVFLEV